MRWKPSRRGILRDNDAQAITEFVIIIPVLLFMWFAMLQTVILAQASQLCSYAAFAAARSYATSLHKLGNPDDAVERAKNSALLVLAPISHAQYGELRPAAHSGGFDPLLTIRSTVNGLPLIVQRLYGIAEGFAVAYLYRVKNFQCTATGSEPTSVVNVSFNYMCPVAIPGFVEMWTYLRDKGGGGKAAHHQFDVGLILADPSSLNSAIHQVFDALAQIESILGGGSGIGGLEGGFSSLISTVYGLGYIGAEFNVTLPAKGVCGFEPWSGTPREQYDTFDDDNPYCAGEVDEEMQECINAMQNQQDELNQAVQVQSNLCQIADQKKDIFVARSNEWAQAVSANQACRTQAVNNGQNPDVQCAAQQTAEDNALTAKNNAHDDAEDARDDCEDAGEDVENNSDFSNIPECEDSGLF